MDLEHAAARRPSNSFKIQPFLASLRRVGPATIDRSNGYEDRRGPPGLDRFVKDESPDAHLPRDDATGHPRPGASPLLSRRRKMPQSIPRSEPPAVLRYGAAIASVVAAVAAGSLLRQGGGNAPLVSLLLCGVLFATWFGGLGPGLLAIALSVLAFAYFFLQPLYSLAVQDYNDIVRLISFAVAALFVVALSARQTSTAQSLRRAHADLQTAVRELEKANALLRQSEKSLQTIIDTIPALVVRYRADGDPDFMNQTMRELVGPGVGLDAT